MTVAWSAVSSWAISARAAYLMQAFDRDSPLPEERLSLLFDLGAPSATITFDEMPANAADLQLQLG